MLYQQLNSKIIKKFIALTLLIFLIMLVFMPYIEATVKPTSDFYVNDYAGLLSNETKQHIMDKSVNLQMQTKAQIVVVTVKNLEGKSLESYATELFREFGIGDKEENNGLLLLLALDERKFRVEVGYGFEGILPDAKTGRFQDDYIIPYLRENNWDEGVLNGFNAFYKEVCEYYDIDANVEIKKGTSASESEDTIVTIGSLIIMIIFIIISYKIGGRGYYGQWRQWI